LRGTRQRPRTCSAIPTACSTVCAFESIFRFEFGQASHAGDLAHAVEAGLVSREHVTELGAVLTGDARGRRSPDEITAFDSTGLAIQDLAIALAAHEVAHELDLPQVDL